MSQKLGAGLLCTLRRRQCHRMADIFEATRVDGVVRRFTGHDRPIDFRRERYAAVTAAERLDESATASMGAGESEIVGFLHPLMVTAREVKLGLWTDARVRHWVVDWKLPWKHYRRATYWVDRVELDGARWRAAVSSVNRFLVPYVGRGFELHCDYVLGHPTTCKKDISPWIVGAGVVDSIQVGYLTFRATAGSWPSPQADHFYDLGSIRWTTGNNAGSEQEIKRWTQASREVALARPTPYNIKIGDVFVARPGCDGLATTCKDRYDNLPNFGQNERQTTEKDKLMQVRRLR